MENATNLSFWFSCDLYSTNVVLAGAEGPSVLSCFQKQAEQRESASCVYW